MNENERNHPSERGAERPTAVLTPEAAAELIKTGKTYKTSLYVEAVKVPFDFTIVPEDQRPSGHDAGTYLVQVNDNGTKHISTVDAATFDATYKPGRRPPEPTNED